MSFFEKLQNLHLKYRIQSVYKIVQKNNPFNKDRKECASVEQGEKLRWTSSNFVDLTLTILFQKVFPVPTTQRM